jgi:hypothetical protein
MAIDVTMQTLDLNTDALQRLERDGYALIRNGGEELAERLTGQLGSVVDQTDVTVDETTEQMVTSSRELGLHTDHGAVDYILWRCVRQSDEGGLSRLVDTRGVLDGLSADQREALQEVYLTEHRVFKDDPEKRPLLRQEDGAEKVYYSFWLLDEDLNERQTDAVEAFRRGVEQAEEVSVRLQPDDLLVIDNRRILHGRSAVEGNKDRLLERYWICEQGSLEQGVRQVDGFVLPEPISEERVDELISAGVDCDVAAIDLSMVKMKLQEVDEGKGWTPAECETAELEYKRYLTLNIRHDDRAIVPTKQIDTMWHYHILDTRAYHADCEQVFGEYFHHFPYFGMRGEEDRENLDASFFETVDLYEEEFGESMLRNHEVATDCWHDCQGRCWNECSND